MAHKIGVQVDGSSLKAELAALSLRPPEDHFHVTEEGAAWFTTPSPSLDQPFPAAG